MEKYYEIARKFDALTDGFKPDAAMVLGSGWDVSVGKEFRRFSFSEAGLGTVGAAGHKGEVVFSEYNGVKLVTFFGRIHYYEGYSMSDVTAAVRAARVSGAEIVLLTNAAGGVNSDFRAGDFMAVTDHIMFAPNPLIGKNDDKLGTRFPDMTTLYDNRLTRLLTESAEERGVSMKEGVYCQFTGPSYETPAEVRMARSLGADAVGMSTAAEAVAARHAGARVAAVSLITNMAAGIGGGALSHEEVTRTAKENMEKFDAALGGFFEKIGKEKYGGKTL